MEKQPAVWRERAIVDRGRNLRESRRVDPEAEDRRAVAEVLDSLYGRA
jgi:hypothetical protein